MSFSLIALIRRVAESAESMPIASEGPTPFAVSSFSNNRFSNTLTNPNSCQESSYTTSDVCSVTSSPVRGKVSYTLSGIVSSYATPPLVITSSESRSFATSFP